MKLLIINKNQNLNYEIKKFLNSLAQTEYTDLLDCFVKQEDLFYYVDAKVIQKKFEKEAVNEKITEVTKEKVMSYYKFEEQTLRDKIENINKNLQLLQN